MLLRKCKSDSTANSTGRTRDDIEFVHEDFDLLVRFDKFLHKVTCVWSRHLDVGTFF